MNGKQQANDSNVNIQGATVGGFVVGPNGVIRDVTITQDLPIYHPQAHEINQKLIEFAELINASDIAVYKKKDALNNLDQLTTQLRNEDSSECRAGAKYFLEQIVRIFENAQPVISLATSISRLLGIEL